MPAEPTDEEPKAPPADEPSAAQPDGQIDSAETAPQLVRRKRKRAPRPTFDDGALTRVFKFPSKKFPKSSYYVTGTEIIIRIKKARKRWKLVVSKKRLASYRTNRWFAKPRWVEIELTYTQAVRHGLVEPAVARAEPQPADAANGVLIPAAPPAADQAASGVMDATAAPAEVESDEMTGWVVDDDTSDAAGDEAYDSFEEAAAGEPDEGGPDFAAANPEPMISEAEPEALSDVADPAVAEADGSAHQQDVAAPVASSNDEPCDAGIEHVEAVCLDVVAPYEAPPEATSVSAAASDTPAADDAGQSASDRASEAALIAAYRSDDEDPPPPARTPLPVFPVYRNTRARAVASALAVLVLCFSGGLGQLGDAPLDAGACVDSAMSPCAVDQIVTGSIDAGATDRTASHQAIPDVQPAAADRQLGSELPATATEEASAAAEVAVALRIERVEEPVAAAEVVGPPHESDTPKTASEANEQPAESAAPVITEAIGDRVASVSCPVEAGAIARSIEMQFEFASASLRQTGLEALDRLAHALKACPAARMTIEGHTDSDGDFYRNQSLSVRRALAVRQHLIDAGAGDGQIKVVGYGQERPVAPNDTEANKGRNRRIEIVIE